ncbi:hypothetical protein pb186bvf_003951 [Paramecium bursaria]
MHSSISETEDDSLYQIYKNLSSVNLQRLMSRMTLFFNKIPSYESFTQLYRTVSQNANQDTWTTDEELLLQYVIISLKETGLKVMKQQQPQGFQLWQQVQTQMSIKKSNKAMRCKYKEFIKKSPQRQQWTQKEDQMLYNLIMYQDYSKSSETDFKMKKKWRLIANQFNILNENGETRSPKQCRERWSNKLDPQINRDQWSVQEEIYFIQLLLQFGKKWADISLKLSSQTNFRRRTEFSLKHRYKCLQRQSNYNDVQYNEEYSTDWTFKQSRALIGKLQQLQSQFNKINSNSYKIRNIENMNFESIAIICKKKIKILASASL